MLDAQRPSPARSNAAPLIDIESLRVEFETSQGTVVGVEDVSFTIAPGETVAVVGESGSGKSVSSLSLMRLVEFGGGRIAGGRLQFRRGHAGGGTEGVVDLAKAPDGLMRTIRGNEIGMIFQEPMTSLNPVFTVGRQLTEGLRVHKGMSQGKANARALELMRMVRIPEPERRLTQYPHELSGGMRQRVVIAMALACEPRLLICDEPTTALDVTIQAEILALIDRLKRDTGTAVMFITHDMAVVAQMADRVVVMYRGRLVETGPVREIFANPQADYTRALLAAVPRLGEMRGKPRARAHAHPRRARGGHPPQPGHRQAAPGGGAPDDPLSLFARACCAASSPTSTRSRTCRSRSTWPRPSASWASRAAASPPRAARSCASPSPPRAASSSAART